MLTSTVLTVTLNPAIDRTIFVPDFRLGQTSEALQTLCTPGGKGINVSRALKILGVNTMPTGFAGGTNGQRLLADLIVEKMEPHFVFIDGETRTNLTISDRKSGKVTRILEPGPVVSAKDLASFRRRISRLVETSDWVVLSGRGIRGTPPGFYRELIKNVQHRGKKVALDTSGQDLVAGLKAKPFFLKLNRSEAEFIMKRKLSKPAVLKQALTKFLSQGVQQVIISLGSEGAVGTDGEFFGYAACPKVRVINTVGSGDALMAGFIYSSLQKRSFEEALKFSVATGTANACHLTPGAFSPNVLNHVLSQISLKPI